MSDLLKVNIENLSNGKNITVEFSKNNTFEEFINIVKKQFDLEQSTHIALINKETITEENFDIQKYKWSKIFAVQRDKNFKKPAKCLLNA